MDQSLIGIYILPVIQTTVPRKVSGTTTKEIFAPTRIVRTAVPTRVVGTASKEMFVSSIIVGTAISTMIVGTAVPTIIFLTAYYWKSCVWKGMEFPTRRSKKNEFNQVFIFLILM